MNRGNNIKPVSDVPGASPAKKAALYLRVSTEYQVDKDSLPMQRKDLEAYATLILGIDQYEVFEDAGYSGKNTARPAFQNMMSRIRKHEFTHVLVWKIDRISRNLIDFSEMYSEFQEYGVTFVSKNEQFDTSSAIGEAMLRIILVFAELERKMTAERVTAAMISRAKSGQWNGGRIPFGYSYDKETKTFSVDPDEAAVCQKLKDKLLSSRSLVKTSRYLNSLGYKTRAGAEWSPTAVWIIASSPFYAGVYRYNRYKGTENRKVNPSDEWVITEDHHPGIFTLDEHDQLIRIFGQNVRHRNKVGECHMSQYAHIFSGLTYCGKCGSKMVSTPGKLHANGYRPTNYSCPKHRNTGECDNPTVSDSIIGEFVINYILNMLNAKRMFSRIQDPEDLELRLLSGLPFAKVDSIDPDGLNDYFNLLSRYGSDDSFKFSIRAPKKKKAAVDPELASLRAEKEKQIRALNRLQDLYLYSDNAMSEKDYLLRKTEITSRLDDIEDRLGMVLRGAEHTMSDEDFVKQASHLLISSYLKDRAYIYFNDLAKEVSPEILQEYMSTVLDSLVLVDGHVQSITFRNGLTHRFSYKA